jgi:hypothetical protein
VAGKLIPHVRSRVSEMTMRDGGGGVPADGGQRWKGRGAAGSGLGMIEAGEGGSDQSRGGRAWPKQGRAGPTVADAERAGAAKAGEGGADGCQCEEGGRWVGSDRLSGREIRRGRGGRGRRWLVRRGRAVVRRRVTEPPKLLGPPTVVLVQRTLDNPIDAHNHLTSSVTVSSLFRLGELHPSHRYYITSEERIAEANYNNLIYIYQI